MSGSELQKPVVSMSLPIMARSRRIHAATPSTASSSQLGLMVLRELRSRILNWHYPPGHHLSEPELCAEFSASRIPVREALGVLMEQGLVEKVPNQGCFVKQPDVESTHHLYDMRLALELFVVERLAQNGLPVELEARERKYWEPLLNIRADEPVDAMAFVTADENFHLSLARVLDNPFIVEALEDINERLRFVRMAVLSTPHRVQATAGEHLMILESIGRKDAEGARRTLRRNISHALNKVEIAIGRALTSAHRLKKPELSSAPPLNPN